MMEFISNPLYIAYLALALAVITLIRVFVPGDEDSGRSKAASAPASAPSGPRIAVAAGEDEEAVVAAITAALSLYVGGSFTIRSIRPAAGGGNTWVTAGRLENVTSL